MTFPEVAEAIRPWISSGALVGLLGLATTFWLRNRKLSIESDNGLREHYTKELAALRAQVLAVGTSADTRMAAAEQRYTEAIVAADQRHVACEAECQRLRDMVSGLERQMAQVHKSSVRLFEPNAKLPEDVKAQMRAYAEGTDK